MKDLADTKAGFLLWYYFAENQNNYEFALSPKAVEAATGIKIKAYNSAIAALIEKGYLVKTKGNFYIFYEKPVMLSKDNGYPLEAQRVMLSKDNGYPPAGQEIIQYYNDNTKDNTFLAATPQKITMKEAKALLAAEQTEECWID